jgi:tetratricopeptide (TPR) repeat protein
MRRFAWIFVFVCAGPLAAQEESWVGKMVITKNYKVKLKREDKDGKLALFKESADSINYRVLEEKGSLIRIMTAFGVDGWIEKTEVVTPDKAIQHFTDVLKNNPRDACAYQRRAYAHEHAGDYDSALKDINETVHLAFGDMARWNSRGILHCARKEYDHAIRDLSVAIRFAPALGSAYCNRGYAWTMKKEYDKAINDFDNAILLEPMEPFGYTNRGLAYFLKKQYAEAHADFDKAQKLDPSNPYAYLNRARLYATSLDRKQRDGKKALELAKKALSLEKNPEPIFFETLATAFAEVGAFDEAIRAQQRVLDDPRARLDPMAQRRMDLYLKKTPFRQFD